MRALDAIQKGLLVGEASLRKRSVSNLIKLGDWLRRNGVKRADFARRIGVSPGAVTVICREGRA